MAYRYFYTGVVLFGHYSSETELFQSYGLLLSYRFLLLNAGFHTVRSPSLKTSTKMAAIISNSTIDESLK